MTPTRTNISKIVQGQREPQMDLNSPIRKTRKKIEKESMASLPPDWRHFFYLFSVAPLEYTEGRFVISRRALAASLV